MTLGDLLLRIGPDQSAWEDLRAVLSSTRDSLQEFVDTVARLGETLDAGLIAPVRAAEQQLSLFDDEVTTMGKVVYDAVPALEAIPPALHDTAHAAADATDKLTEFILEGLKLVGITLSLEAMKEAVIGSLEKFGELQRAGEAIGAITGSAGEAAAALAEIPEIADRIGVSITSAEEALVRFTSFGVDLGQIPAVLDAIASGAVASGRSFETVAQSWERMTNTGALMSRTLQNAGLNMQEVATAMHMAGASSNEVSAAFKGIQDTIDGVSAASQRAAILMQALPDSVKNLADKTDDVTKSFQQMKNAVHEAMVQIGDDLAAMGQAGGIEALKVAIGAIETVILGLITVLGESITFVVSVFKLAADGAVAFGIAMDDIAKGEFLGAVDAIKAGAQQIAADWAAAAGKMESEFTSTGRILSEVWGDTAASVSTDTKNMADHVAQSGEAVNKTVDTMVSNFQNLGGAISQALLNAQNAFDRAAAAMAAGTGSVKEYETALKALATEQENENGGLENAKTAMLLAADAHRQMAVAAANASITLAAISADLRNGAASASQYSAALAALNKFQMELNNGLQAGHTAYLLAVDDFQKLTVQTKNANTDLNAIAQAVLDGKSSLTQFDQELQKLNADFMATHGGLQDFQTVVELAGVSLQKVGIELQNEEMKLQALFDQFQAGYPVLQQFIDQSLKTSAAMTKAAGGVEDWRSALLKIEAEHSKAELTVQNLTTELGVLGAKMAEDSSYAGAYAETQKKLQNATDALTGAHHNVAAAADRASASQYNLNTARQQGATQSLNNVNVENDYATSLAIVDGKLTHLGIAYGDTVSSASDFAGTIQKVNGQVIAFSSNLNAASGTASEYATSIAYINGQMVNLSTACTAADGTVNQLSADMLSAAVSAGSLADAVRAGATGFVPGGGQSGTIAGQPGDVVTQRTEGGGIASQITLGTPLQRAQKELADLQAPAQLQAIYDQINKLGHAGSTLNTAATKLAVAVQPFQDAATLQYEAAKAALAASTAIVGATNSLNSSALAAADAANQLAFDNSRLSGTVDLAVQIAQNASQTSLAATQAVEAANSLVGDMVTVVASTLAPVVSGFSTLIRAVTQPGPTIPGYTPGPANAPISPAWGPGAGGGLQGSHPTVNLTVNAGTVVGGNGIQELTSTIADTLVQQLGNVGIRAVTP
jgi:hypothetical protein